MKLNLSKHVCDGWTIGQFVEELEIQMAHRIHEIEDENQLYGAIIKIAKDIFGRQNEYIYKKSIWEIVNHFKEKYNIE